MKKTYLLILLGLCSILFSNEKTLTPKDVIQLLVKNNYTVKVSKYNSDIAKSVYEGVLSSSKPNLTFTTDTFSSPLYGYSNINSETQTLSGKLLLTQNISTGGSLSIGLSDIYRLTKSSTGDWDTSQTPSLEFSLRQPILANNKIIDFKLFKSSLRKSEISHEIAELNEVGTRNQLIITVLTSIQNINILRNSIDLLSKGLDIAQERVVMARDDREVGRISSSDLLALELDVAKQEETLFDVKYNLEMAEINLERLLGLERVKDYTFDLNILEGIETSTVVKESQNSNEKKALLDLEKQILNKKLNRIIDAPTLSVYFKTNSDLDINFGLGVNINILDGGSKKQSINVDDTAIKIARESLLESQKNVNDNNRILNSKVKLLKDKISLLKKNIEYDEILLDREKELLEIGSSTQINVKTVELELLNRQKDINNIYGELYLTLLEIINLNGGSVEDYI